MRARKNKLRKLLLRRRPQAPLLDKAAVAPYLWPLHTQAISEEKRGRLLRNSTPVNIEQTENLEPMKSISQIFPLRCLQLQLCILSTYSCKLLHSYYVHNLATHVQNSSLRLALMALMETQFLVRGTLQNTQVSTDSVMGENWDP